MNKNRQKSLTIAVTALGIFSSVLSMNTVPIMAAQNDTYTISKTYDSETKNETYDFQDTIKKNGKTYLLDDVSYKVLKETPIERKEEILFSTDPVMLPEDADYAPASSIERDDMSLSLKEITTVQAEPYIQEVSGSTDYEYEISRSLVPQTKSIEVKNEKTGTLQTVDCTLQSFDLIGHTWKDSYIDITIEGYNQTALSWQGITFANNMGDTPLKGYETQILQSVGLDSNTGKVDRTYWTTNPYTNSTGTVCRDGKADIQKLVPVYRASYNGSLVTPMYEKTAIYTGLKKISDPQDLTYTIKATAHYIEKKSIFSFIVVDVAIMLFILFIIAFLYILHKKKKEKGKDIPQKGGN